MRKYNWTIGTFNSVYWEGIERARKRGSLTQLVQTSKIMHGWLPVNHMVGHSTQIRQCPGCTEMDETIDHLFHCSHPRMRQTINERMIELKKFLRRSRAPRSFATPLIVFIQSYIDNNSHPITENALAQEAFQSQMDIGQEMIVRGFLSTEWLHLLRNAQHDRPDALLTKVIWFLWHDFLRPLWKTRNDILHRTCNNTTGALEAKLDGRLDWFLENRYTALSRSDQTRLLNYTRETLSTWPLTTKQEQVRHLEIAKRAWDIECLQKGNCQTVLTRFFSRVLTIGDSVT